MKTKQEKKGLKRGTQTHRSIRGLTGCLAMDADNLHRFICGGDLEENENIGYGPDTTEFEQAVARLNVLFTVAGVLKNQRDKFKNTTEFLKYCRNQ